MADPQFYALPSSGGRLGMRDVEQLEAQTRALRAVDYRSGGGMCREAVLVRIQQGNEMLGRRASEAVRKRLFAAVADLHNLAGWTSFDSGHVGAAYHHLDLALELAEQAGNGDLTANIHYRCGRIRLHHGATDEALAQFQLGQLAAQRSASRLAAAILCANQAWAYGKKRNEELAVELLGRAEEEFADAEVTDPPDWARFFTRTDVAAMTGSVHTELALAAGGGRHAATAVDALTEAVGDYGPDMARSRTLCLMMLATNHLLAGDTDHGVAFGREAIESAETLHSVRTKDRVRPLKREADRRRDNRECRALAEYISAYVTSPS